MCVVVFFQVIQSRELSRAPGITVITGVSYSVNHQDNAGDDTPRIDDVLRNSVGADTESVPTGLVTS